MDHLYWVRHWLNSLNLKNERPLSKLNDFSTSGIRKVKEAITEEDLEEGEVICSKCKGVGFLNKIESDNISIYKGTCSKCQGSGKVDWIENVMGKKPTTEYGTSSSSFVFADNGVFHGEHGTSGCGDYLKEATSIMAEQLAKKIDDEILETLKKGG